MVFFRKRYAGRPMIATASTFVRKGVAPNRPVIIAFTVGSRSVAMTTGMRVQAM